MATQSIVVATATEKNNYNLLSIKYKVPFT